jgi:SnoaL-like domain
MQPLEAEISALLERVVNAWNALDFDALRALWDEDDPRPFYLAEEVVKPLTSWQALDGYWSTTRRLTRAVSMRIANVTAKPLGDAHAVGVWDMHWNADVAGYPRPLGADNRVTAVFRRCGAEWRFVHYAEAPLAPLTYLRTCYEHDVDPEFRAAQVNK